MSRISRLFALIVPVAITLALVAVPEAHAQPMRGADPPPPPIRIAGGGTDLFRAFLDREGIQPVRQNELNNFRFRDDVIVIVIGSTARWDWDPLGYARSVIQSGGAALIATDFSTALYASDQNPGFNNALGWINGQTARANWQDCHRNTDDCPYVVPVSPEELRNPPEKPGRVWNVFRGLNKLATNQPSYITEPFNYRAEYQYPLARLPKSTTVWGQRLNPPHLFAVGGDGVNRWGGNYSFLAVADSSVYINQMIMEPDTDNLEFTLRTIDYLQGPEKNRKRCVFFENGRVIENFDGLRNALSKPKPKIPPSAVPNMGPIFSKNQDKLVDLGNRLADQFQTKDGIHNMLVGREGSSREQRSFGKWVEAALVVLAIFITLLLLRRTISARQPMDVPPPPTTGAGAASTGPPGVFDRRQKELVRRNNLYEPVRNMMREFFDSVGAPPNPGPRMPRLHISHVVRKPDSLRQALRDMWRIAYGPPLYISAQRWFELEPYFNRLRQAHADGKWRFETDEES